MAQGRQIRQIDLSEVNILHGAPSPSTGLAATNVLTIIGYPVALGATVTLRHLVVSNSSKCVWLKAEPSGPSQLWTSLISDSLITGCSDTELMISGDATPGSNTPLELNVVMQRSAITGSNMGVFVRDNTALYLDDVSFLNGETYVCAGGNGALYTYGNNALVGNLGCAPKAAKLQ
jgi:hypothetical protein